MLFRFAISTASLLGSVLLFGLILWAASYVAKEAEFNSIQGIPLSEFKRTEQDPDKPNPNFDPRKQGGSLTPMFQPRAKRDR